MDKKRIVENKVVLMALKSIASRINPSDGILVSHYKKVVKDTFEILKNNRETYDTIQIKGWFIRKAKFKPMLVNDIVDIAKKMQEGTRRRPPCPRRQPVPFRATSPLR